MIGINQMKKKIKDDLEKAFSEADLSPLISLTTTQLSEKGNADLEKEAIACSGNGAIFINHYLRTFGLRTGGIYAVVDTYFVVIYMDDPISDETIIDYFEIASNSLFPSFGLLVGKIEEGSGYKSGKYLAWIRINTPEQIYMGV